MFLSALGFLVLIPSALAVFADEAYQVDFHYPLLGFPQANSTFFHQPVAGSKASLLYTLSDKSLLGAVSPKDGQIVWRQVLPSNGPNPGVLRTGEDLDVLLAVSGPSLSAWSAADGKLAWEHDYTPGNVVDVQVSAGSVEAVLVLKAQSTVVTKIDAQTGKEVWTYGDESGDEPFRVSHSSDKVHLISLHKTLLKGLKIKVTTLDAKTGTKVSEHSLPSDSDVSSLDDIVAVNTHKTASLVVWTDAKRGGVKVNILGQKDVQTLETTAAGRGVEKIELSSSSGSSHFVLNFQTSTDHWGESFSVEGQTVKKAHVFPALGGPGAWSTHYINGKDYLVRVSANELVLNTPNSQIAAYPIRGLNVAGLVGEATPVHVSSEVVFKLDGNHAVRSAVLLSTGDWVMIRNGEASWNRPEALSGLVDAIWADCTDSSDDVTFEASANPFTAFEHRLRRHIKDLQNLPGLLTSLPDLIRDIANNFLSNPTHPNKAFGFDKLLIASTENGRYVAIDMGRKGEVLWNVAARGTTPATEDELREMHESSLSTLGVAHSKLSFRDESRPLGQEHSGDDETTYKVENGVLLGSRAGVNGGVWRFSPYSGFHIHSVTPPYVAGEPVASIGKVLGDRKVLYKYLNANTVAVITANEKSKKVAVNLLDAVTGNVLYVSHYDNVDTSRPITSALSENWLAFSYIADTPDDSVSKGFQLVMAEFYESDVPNDRGNFGTMQNYSTTHGDAPSLKPFAYAQVFHIPEEISQMAVTQTAQGITTKQLLVGLSRTNSIVAIPPQALDPRRVVGKDPTNQQMSEGLSRYTPMIDFDPKWYLNHREEIVGLKKIMTTPAALESTSLVFAYGLDLFGTRVAPSFAFDILGNSFNKIQLSLTVVALTAAVFFVAPIIQRKQTNLLFQS